MLNTAVGRVRITGILEGLSFLLLLGIAMPLKYMAGLPIAVTITGAVHGFLFVLYVLAVALASLKHRWSFKRVIIALGVAFIPFAPFVFEKTLKKEQLS
jgi:integral membrane protein